MRILTICIVFILLVPYVQAQTGGIVKRYNLDFFDLYVLKVKVEKNVCTGYDNCVYKKGLKCNLFRVAVEGVLYYPSGKKPDSVIVAGVQTLKYIIAPAGYADSLRAGRTYLITTRPTTSGNYLALSRLLDMDAHRGYTYYHRDVFLTSLVSCGNNRKDPFDRYIRKKEGSRLIAQR